MCRRLGLIYLVVTSLSMNVVLSAPSQKRLDSNLKQFEQSPQTVKAYGEEWYPVKDSPKENESGKREPPPFKEEKSTPKGKDKPAVPTNKKGNVPKDQHNSDFKTICEDKDVNGKCLTVQSKNEPSSDNKQTEQSADQQLKAIDHLISSQHKLTDKEAAQIRQIIANMSKKINELEKSANKPCTNSPADYPDREVAEIEERHIKEKKLVKKKEHDEKVNSKSEKDSLKGSNDVDASKTVVPTKPDNVGEQQTNDDSNSIDQNSSTDLKSSDNSPPLEQKEGKITSTSRTPVAPVNSVSSDANANPNYLEGSASDVNFNGGINKPMDVLIQEHPDGVWPDKSNAIEEIEDSTGFSESDYLTESGKEGDNSSDYEDENDMNVINLQDHEPSNAPSIHPLLNPKYLENIIKQQQKTFASSRHKNKQENDHHVQEHVLPNERRI